MRMSTVRHAAGLACIWYAYSAYAEMRDSGGDMTQEWMLKVAGIALGGIYFGFWTEISSGTLLAYVKKQAAAALTALQQPDQPAPPAPPQAAPAAGLPTDGPTAAEIQAVFLPPLAQPLNPPIIGCDSEAAQLVRHVDKLIEIANGDQKLADQVLSAQDALLRKLQANKNK